MKRIKKLLADMPDTTKELKEERKSLKNRLKILKRPFKTAYSIEQEIYKSGPNKGRVNWHYHIFITGGLNDKLMERLWDKGIRVNCNNFQPERFGPEAAAKYTVKANVEKGKKRYICSRNMVKPKVPDPSRRDRKTSARQVERWAKERIDDADFWERKYKGYKFIHCFARKNPFNGRYYLSVIMYRTDKEIPPWAFDDWITDE